MAQQIMNAQNSIVLVPKRRSVTLVCRRLVAWSLEIGLVAMSAVVPWGVGQYALVVETNNLLSSEETAEATEKQGAAISTEARVILNPLVYHAQQGWAWVAQIPPHQLYRTVPRLTNVAWTIALVAPVVVTFGQLAQLWSTGRTWPKQWLGIQVFSTTAGYYDLGLVQVLLREAVRWGIPVTIVVGVTTATGLSLGLWTPVLIGVLALVEGGTALIWGGGRSWHDRIAKTQVAMAAARSVPISGESLLYTLPSNGHALPLDSPNYQGSNGIQLYGETDDDEWWLTEAGGDLTSLVLPPRSSTQQQTEGGSLVLSVSRPSYRSWWLVAGSMALACITGFGIGRVGSAPFAGQPEEDTFLQIAQELITKTQAGEDHNAAILMLAQVDDPRTVNYLTDLLSQSSQPKTLATIQQALISQGLDSVPSLLALSHGLENDLLQSLEPETRSIRLAQRHVVQSAIAKLLTVHSSELAGIRLDRVNLGRYHDAERTFRLIQPGLLAAGSSWQGANLSRANLAGARFFDVGADGRTDSYDDVISDLSGVDLSAARLEGANLQGALLSYANLRRAELRDATLAYGNLEKAQLTNANLVNVDAAHSRWQGSNLVGADLTQAVFRGADLSQARLNRIEAAQSSWTKATLTRSDWVEANLLGADFSQANLLEADFEGAQLDSVDFTRADLRQANLQNANLRQATLTGVNLANANLAGAIFDDGTRVTGSFITPNAPLKADNHLQGVNFSRVRNLDGRQLNYICAQGGIHPACQQMLDSE